MKHVKKLSKPAKASASSASRAAAAKTREILAREGKSAQAGCPERSHV